MNYFASEVALTPHTKKLWENKPAEVFYPMPEFDPKPYVKQDNKPVKRYVKKLSKVQEQAIEDFQQNRIFSVIRGMQ